MIGLVIAGFALGASVWGISGMRRAVHRLERIGAAPTVQNLFIVGELEQLYWLEKMQVAPGWDAWDPYEGREREPALSETGESSWNPRLA